MPKIYHVWSHNPSTSLNTLRRVQVAQRSWRDEAEWAGNWTLIPVEGGRGLTEDRNLPFIKDLINIAFDRAEDDEDILSLSNADVGCIHGITGYVLDRVRSKGCCFAHRYDVEHRQLDVPISWESDVRELRWYPGSDWFWMSKAWWAKYRDEFPDMVLGREYWDAVLRQLMKKSGGTGIPFAVWHEKHESEWDRPHLRGTLPGNIHNGLLATRWFAERHSDANDPYRDTWNIVPGVTANVDPSDGGLLRRTRPQIVHPIRLEFHQNPKLRPPIPS